MRRALLPVVALLLLVVGCGPEGRDEASESAGPPITEREGIPLTVEAFLNRYVRAIGERDTAALRDMYAEPDRFVWIEDGAVRYRSASEVFQSLGQFEADTPIDTELGEPGVTRLEGGGVHTWASFTTTVGEGKASYSFGGLMSFVLEPADGAWRIVGGHVSSPRSRGSAGGTATGG